MNPEQLFRGVCDSPGLEAAVQLLNEPQLSRLIVWLRQQGPRGGVRALVLGVAEATAVERYLKTCPP